MDRLIGRSSSPACSSSGEASSRLRTLGQIALADRRGDGFSFGRGAVRAGELGLQQLLHLGVAAVAGDFEQLSLPQGQRVGAVLEQEGRDFELVLAHGEVQRRAVFVVRARERGSLSTSRLTVSRSPVMQAQNISQTSAPMPGDQIQTVRSFFSASGRIMR